MSDIQSTIASPPFNRDNADIIVRSSDNVDFHVFKSVLALSSPVFNDMFAIPQPTEHPDHKDGISVITVEEDAEVLDRLLRYCYPGAVPEIMTIEDVYKMMPVAHKYEMDFVLEQVSDAYLGFKEIKNKPFNAFALAFKYKLEKLGRMAAKATLYYSVDELLQQEVDFGAIPAQEYRQILQYHRRCRVACCKMTQNLQWIKDLEQYAFRQCSMRLNRSDTYDTCGELWWAEHMQRLRVGFLVKGPCAVDVENLGQILSDITRLKCTQCSLMAAADMLKIGELFKAQVASTISSIPLGIGF